MIDLARALVFVLLASLTTAQTVHAWSAEPASALCRRIATSPSEEQLTGIVNEHGRVYRFRLGPTGEVDEEHGFDGLMRRYTRDKTGQVTRVDRAGKRFSEYRYNPAGGVIKVEHSDESAEHYAYRMDGELTHASNGDASLVFERDALGRIVKAHQNEHWVESEYDLLGMRTRMRSSLGADVEITRGTMGDALAMTESGQFLAHFTRDQLGLELARTLPGGLYSRWQRDSVGRPVQRTVSTHSGALRDVGYKWEHNDRLRMVIDALEGPTEYRHDALGNLAWARYAGGDSELRMPDAVGNLFKREDRKDRVYGPAGQLLAQGTARGDIKYAYDAEGNLVEKTEPGGRIWRYEWNGAGMMSKVTRPDGTEVTFGYDALGRRVRKSYRGQNTRWIWDGNVPLHEWVDGLLEPLEEPEVPYMWSFDPLVKKREAELTELLAQGPPERGTKKAPITWLFEPESFAPMAKLVAGQRLSIIADHLGTPALMADAEGAAVWSAGVSVYGELRDLKGPRHACPFRWPGQYEDVETGLYYNRFRYYDPEAGQYCSQDPIGLAGGPAPYAYVHDPSDWMDPLGLKTCRGRKTHVFWSMNGNPGVKTAAEDWARRNGATTLERTGKGSLLQKHATNLDWIEAQPAWRKSSTQFAKSGKGEVHVFLPADGASPTSIWETVEKPLLEQNPNVTKIIPHIIP